MPAFDIEAELAAIVDAFDAHRLDHAVCGALALADLEALGEAPDG